MAFEFALAADEGAAGARYIHECWKRGHFAAHIETVLDLMWKRARAPAPNGFQCVTSDAVIRVEVGH